MIRTRPEDDFESDQFAGANVAFGSRNPQHVLYIDDDQLTLLAALLYNTTLGMYGYPQAASLLSTALDKLGGGPDFSEHAANLVDIRMSLLDDNGDEIDVIDNEHFSISLL